LLSLRSVYHARCTVLLYTTLFRFIRMPQQDWVICPNAFEAIIDEDLFNKAQAAFLNFTCHLSDDDMLERLRTVLRSEGKLSSERQKEQTYEIEAPDQLVMPTVLET